MMCISKNGMDVCPYFIDECVVFTSIARRLKFSRKIEIQKRKWIVDKQDPCLYCFQRFWAWSDQKNFRLFQPSKTTQKQRPGRHHHLLKTHLFFTQPHNIGSSWLIPLVHPGSCVIAPPLLNSEVLLYRCKRLTTNYPEPSWLQTRRIAINFFSTSIVLFHANLYKYRQCF